MPTLISFLLRAFLLLAGIVFAASLAVASVLALLLWGVRAAWGRLTGRRTTAFALRFDPRTMFRTARQRPQPRSSRTPRADAVPTAGKTGGVSDVEAKPRAQ